MRDLTSALQKHWLQVRSGQQAVGLSASWQENSQHTSETIQIDDKALRSSCMSIRSYVTDLTEGGRRLHVADCAVAAMLLRGYVARSTILAWSASSGDSVSEGAHIWTYSRTCSEERRL